MGVAAGDDSRSLSIAGVADDFGIELFSDAFLHGNVYAAFSNVLLALFQGLGGKVFQDFELIGTFADDGTQGDGNGQTNHACAWDAYPHGVLQDIATQQNFDSVGSTSQPLGSFRCTECHAHRFRTSYGWHHLFVHQCSDFLSDVFRNHYSENLFILVRYFLMG